MLINLANKIRKLQKIINDRNTDCISLKTKKDNFISIYNITNDCQYSINPLIENESITNNIFDINISTSQTKKKRKITWNVFF